MDAILIHNPVSGNPAQHNALERARMEFRAAGWQVTTWQTQRRGHARELAEQAVREGWPCVIIAGGDGSIEQTVDGILQAGMPNAGLGIIPLGTGNVFAREVGLPFPTRQRPDAPTEAARIIIRGEPKPLDVGMANGRAFLCWAGLGIDAAATAKVEADLEFKRRAPIANYVVEALRTIAAYRPGQTQVVVDGDERLEGRFPLVVASNIALYARWFKMAPLANVSSRSLDLTILKSPDAVQFVYTALKILLYPRTRDRRIRRRTCRRLQITSDPPAPYHLDGDPQTTTPLDIELLPAHLPVYLK